MGDVDDGAEAAIDATETSPEELVDELEDVDVLEAAMILADELEADAVVPVPVDGRFADMLVDLEEENPGEDVAAIVGDRIAEQGGAEEAIVQLYRQMIHAD